MMTSTLHETFVVLLFSAAAAAAGCLPDSAGPATPAKPLVEITEIEGAVAAEDQSALADQIPCAGAADCHSDKPALASVDACIQDSACAARLGKLLQGLLVAEGTPVHTAVETGDHRRVVAARGSRAH
ncbi:hypothetical protein [Polyangium sp. 15x6]|uniref:hypothetical protein n=1 Tax=Polyangium sp. 15x6 TaxID=3042687 RepID=UPI00249BB9C9|nr:hypothetical protein [Polyangium sp. 15x6]MDI3286010.1 hypothetical protein [Polyangium sp. 15x6]